MESDVESRARRTARVGNSMKVLDLQCAQGHEFEGWFASEDDYRSQLARKLVICPVCGNTDMTKKLSAPRLNLRGGARAPAKTEKRAEHVPSEAVAALPPKQLQAAWMDMVRQVLAHTEDVGPRFAEEARRIHYGEAEERGIRGQATRSETEELIEEGIAVTPLPIPDNLKNTLQ